MHKPDIDFIYKIPPPSEVLEEKFRPDRIPDSHLRTAIDFLWMPSLVRRQVSTDLPHDQWLHLARSKKLTEYKLSLLDMDLPDYFDAYHALKTGNRTRLRELVAHSDTGSATPPEPDTKSIFTHPETGCYFPSRRRLHESILQPNLASVRPARSPTFTGVIACYATGKTEILRKQLPLEEGIYVSDPDSLRPHLIPDFDGTNPAHVRQTQREVADIGDAGLHRALKMRGSAYCETSFGNPQWWNDVVHYVRTLGYTVNVILATRPIHGCFRRGIAERDRSAPPYDYLRFTERLPKIRSFLDNPGITSATHIHLTDPEGPDETTCPFLTNFIDSIHAHPKMTRMT